MDAKPFFLCSWHFEHRDKDIVFVVTKRDGSMERIPAPPRFTVKQSILIFQRADSDDVEIAISGRDS